MYEINSIGAKYINYVIKNSDYYLDYISHTLEGKQTLFNEFKEKNYSVEDSACNWFFIQRNQKDIDFLEFFEKLGIDVKECKFPDRKFSWIKLNYDIELENFNIPELI